MKINKKNIYITLFSILYGGVALVSLIHAVSFFGLANVFWLAILLAVIFEIGQSAVLFSILTSSTGKSKTMPWILMCILTLVQILGNVFSSYKYIVTNSPDNLRYFKEPIFIWTSIPDDMATVIITYIVGGILPLVALAMSAMVTNYLEENKEEKQLLNNHPKVENQDDEEKSIKELEDKHNDEIEKLKKELETERSLHQDISEEFPKVIEENGKKDEEIKQLKEDHDKVLDEKFETEKKLEDALEKTGDLNKSLVEKNNEIENLKKELEGLKQSKENTDENSIEHIKESNGQESDTGESKPGVDDTISEGTGVEETTKEELVEEPVEENIQKRESHFINI